jgi:hypothetical protein
MTKVQVRAAAAVTVTSTAKLFDPANTGGKIVILRAIMSADTDGVYQLQDGSGGTTVAAVYLAAKTSQILDFNGLDGTASEFGMDGAPLTAANSLYAVGPSGGKLTITAVTVESGF